jgi:serine/threonine protein kinase
MISIEQGQDYEDVDEALLPFVHVQHLGHGHSGTVEEVRDRNTGEVYARKTIRITGTKQKRVERTRIFRNEVGIIRGLGGHCHIIAVHATYVTKRDFGILLSPVASDGDLELFLDNYNQNYGDSAETPSLNPQTQAMARVLQQGFGCLAAGLAFIHMKRIRHKDIKPRNILVHKGMLIYTDFGYSFDSNGFSRSTTEGRPDFLTRRYSPPEAIQHEKRNSKSDIYSLGCVFLNMFSALTQAIAYDEDSIFSAIMGSIHEQLDSAVLPPRWAFMSPIIKSMTMYERCDRPAAQLVATTCVANEGFSCSHCHQLHSVSSDRQEDDDDTVENLRFAALDGLGKNRSNLDNINKDKKVDCPVYKHHLMYGMTSPCSGLCSSSMSQVRHHLNHGGGHKMFPQFIRQCSRCKRDFVEQQAYEEHTSRVTCISSPQFRGDKDVPWALLYLALYPDAQHVPVPEHGDIGWLPASTVAICQEFRSHLSASAAFSRER